MALFDVDEGTGNATKASFDKDFGPDRTLFCVCDVTLEKQFKGRLTCFYKKPRPSEPPFQTVKVAYGKTF